MVRLYAALCIISAILALWFFGSFLADEGLDVGEFFDQMTDSDIALFAWADVVVAALAVIAFAAGERVPRWGLAVLGTVLVGPRSACRSSCTCAHASGTHERLFDAVRAAR